MKTHKIRRVGGKNQNAVEIFMVYDPKNDVYCKISPDGGIAMVDYYMSAGLATNKIKGREAFYYSLRIVKNRLNMYKMRYHSMAKKEMGAYSSVIYRGNECKFVNPEENSSLFSVSSYYVGSSRAFRYIPDPESLEIVSISLEFDELVSTTTHDFF